MTGTPAHDGADRLTHVDQVRVTYHEIRSPWSEEDRTPQHSLLLIVSPSGPLDLDELRRLAEGIPGGPDYILDQNVHHHSWGADATVVEFVVQAAASGVIGSIGWEALKSFARAVTGGRKPEHPRPLEESEARGWAEQMAVRRFPDLVLDDLVVRRVELGEPNATVTLGCRDGSTVTVELEIQDGLIALGAVTRDYPSP